MTKHLLILTAMAVFSAQVLAHGSAMDDPAHREKMREMMQKKQMDKDGKASHQHGSPETNPSASKEQRDWGIAGDETNVTRTVRIEMTDDMKYTPPAITIKRNETVRFEVANKGKVMHEMVIGTKKELESHAALMKKHPNMEHDEPYMAHAGPGKSESITWLFNRPGEFFYACLVPGHYEAGMVGRITVTP